MSFVLPKAIADFQVRHPGVRFQLKEAGSREVEQNVVDGALELGMVTLPVSRPELDVRPLTDDRIVLIAPKTILWPVLAKYRSAPYTGRPWWVSSAEVLFVNLWTQGSDKLVSP